jgi:hypothetical protein
MLRNLARQRVTLREFNPFKFNAVYP